MTVFLDDGSIVFADAFALTRLDPKGKAKNVPELFTSPRHEISAGTDPPALLARGGHSYQVKLLDPTTLSPLKPALTHTPALTLSGGRFLDGTRVTARDGKRLGTLPLPDEVSPHTVRFDELGGASSTTAARAFEGKLAMPYKNGQRTIVGLYDLEQDSPPLLLQADVATPGATVLDVWPDRGGLTLVVWSLARRAATAVRLDLAGRETARVTVGAIALPVVDGARLVAQPDENTVRATPLDGSAVVDFAIDAISRKAAARPKAPAGRDDRGPGRILAGNGRTLLVPWHGETVLDLDAAQALDRKLPAKTARLREVVTGLCREHGETLRANGYVHPLALQMKADGRVNLAFWSLPMDRSMEAEKQLHSAFSAGINALDGHRLGSFGHEG